MCLPIMVSCYIIILSNISNVISNAYAKYISMIVIISITLFLHDEVLATHFLHIDKEINGDSFQTVHQNSFIFERNIAS